MKKFSIRNFDLNFKREYIFKILFLIVLGIAAHVKTLAFEVDGIKYNIENSETKEVSVSGLSSSNNSSNISIPASVEYSDVTYSVTSIRNNALYKCTKISSIVIPTSVKSIGEYAFCYCSGLTSITIPGSVSSIGKYAFFKCTNMTSVAILDGVVTIGECAFEICTSLETITLPNSLTAIGDAAFWECRNVNYVKSEIKQPFEIQNTVFDHLASMVLQVPKGSKPSYLQLSGWSSFKTIIEEGTNYFDLTINSTGSGNVIYNNEYINNESKVVSYVEEGSKVSVTILPSVGYQIKSVTVNGNDVTSQIVNSNYTLTINSITTIDVVFEAKPEEVTPVVTTTYSLSIKALGNGSVAYGNDIIREATKSYILDGGTSVTTSFSPDNGYRIKSVTVNGIGVGVESSYSTTINSNTTIEVEFESNSNPTPTPEATYTLAITATGGGTASYHGETIKNGTKSYLLTNGTEVLISFNSEVGYRMKRVSQNNEDITSKITNYSYLLNITSNTTITVDFEELENAIVANGINYYVESYDQHRVKVNEGNYIKVLDIPEKFTVQDQEWTVVGILKEALDNCDNLVAIIWNPGYKFEARISNPNLLLYIKSGDYAPGSVNNVIVNGTAKSITLTDAHSGNDFYCPQAFKAERITYTHRYGMRTGMGESRGWETIALPFDVQQVTLGDKSLKPFAAWRSGDAAMPFWLYLLSSNGYAEAESIKAYTPYLISMPNNEKYIANYRLSGAVVFTAENVEIKKSDEVNIAEYKNRKFVPNFATQETNAGYYALNVNNEYETYQGGEAEGSKFVLNLRKIHPFEAYMTTAAGTRTIDLFDSMTTSIKDNWMIEEDPSILRVYDLNGRMVGQGTSIEDIKQLLPKGIYVVNHQKIIIK